MGLWNFVRQFCKEPRTIGAIAPSSNLLAQRIVEPVDFSQTRVIVEYGPGTGVFTRHILSLMNENTVFFGLELNEHMNHLASSSIPEVTIYQDSASEVCKYLKQYGVAHADAIISGLPWAVFPENLQDEILSQTVAGLPDGGFFASFAYLHGLILPSGTRFRTKLKQHFSSVEISPVVWRNLPPAIVYWCRK